ncbi:S-adenosyl-L-methionine-dependent methyltransferase [Aspergillus pseudotamarii]|uniref:S-adenosyl-L-methionine-dependent methyltransferase n=1 Tax=Aspergillus pseudotamarii TaxID=132259 RepID=A0A5N6SYH2_ASPPS|nr:S-adenosyl-L-methionine-dependent methyltransferase [Aspergillus pseudotamarii]KAE8139728.1 S-adenosyl-L-methionine-dependent methyltransferase [Aspergillus pseudotamarii]
MIQTQADQKDYWSSETYEAAASFVPHFADTLVQSIPFKPTDRILDIGCGDGKYTTRFAPAVSYVLGVDSSPSMIAEAKTLDYGETATDFRIVDCRHLEENAEVMQGNWDKVTSNAALHWILKDPTTRMSTLKNIFQSMKSGGTFFFEMCGHGNAPEMTTAFMFALVDQGVPIETVEEVWALFYPSDVYMKEALESVGFQVKMIALNPQPLELTTNENGGLEGFLRLIGAQMLDILDTQEEKNSVIKKMCRMLRFGTTRENGSQWITYASLRCVAVKP